MSFIVVYENRFSRFDIQMAQNVRKECGILFPFAEVVRIKDVMEFVEEAVSIVQLIQPIGLIAEHYYKINQILRPTDYIDHPLS
jgi:hypothetical protein